jgi:glycosyltransferase involved in cell wall biosynthesis
LLSVVICTYRRPDLLGQALASLAAQQLSRDRFEVLVVDNNSQDATRAVTEAAAERCGNVRYFLETRQGLSHARNLGWRESRGDWVGYIDDDCKVPPQWLAVAEEIVRQHEPGALGGPFYAFYDSPRPAWYKDSYGCYELGAEARALGHDEFFYGGNMFFRRRLIEAVGGFDAELGMAGEHLGYGEEIVPQQLLRARMPDTLFYYDPRLFVYHLVRAEKMTLRWMARDTFVRAGYVQRVFHPDARRRRKLGVLREAVKVVGLLSWDCVRGLVHRDRRRYPYVQHYFGEHTLRYVRWLGTLREQYRRAEQR